MSKVQIRNIVKSYDGAVRVLNDVSLEIPQGKVTALLGPSGCGKSTMLRLIAGLEDHSAGSITIGDTVVSDAARRLHVVPERRGIGMVFQSYALWPHMTVYENVAYPLKVKRAGSAHIRKRVPEALATVGLAGFESRPASMLSGGQAQRVALARALVSDPQLLLLDEPLSNLDTNLRDEMRLELRRVQQLTGITTILVTHDRIEAMAIADNVVVMQKGNIEQIASPTTIYNDPASFFVMDFLGRPNKLPAKVVAKQGDQLAVTLHGRDSQLQGIASAQSAGLSAGAAAVVCVRPEDLTVRDAQTGGETLVTSGTVLASGFLGSAVEHLVRVGNVDVRTYSQDRTVHALGATVTLHARPADVRIWPADAA